MTKTLPAIAILAIGALLICGCGGGSDSSSSGAEGGAYGSGEESAASANNTGASAAAESGGTAAVVAVGKAGDLGKVIVDSEGFTLYDFHKDKGTESACYGACAKAWPPLITSGAPKAMSGAQSSMLGTTKRKDGTTQVTYAGHPVYTFVEDSKPGEANGNDFTGFGAQWYALEPNGEEPED